MFKKSFLAIIALMAIIGFAFTACDKDEGGGIAVKVRATNNNGNKPSGAKSVVAGSARAINDATGESEFSTLTAIYSHANFGSLKDSITPDKFVMAAQFHAYYNQNEMAELGSGVFDFKQGMTVTLDDIQGGITVQAFSLFLAFEYGVQINGAIQDSVVEFTWPGGSTDFNDSEYKNFYGTSGAHTYPTWNGDKITIRMSQLMPSTMRSDNNFFTFLTGTEIKPFGSIYFGAGTRRMYSGVSFPWSQIIPGFTSWKYGGAEIDSHQSHIVVPFDPINIPSNASSVTLNISWNLNDLISVYEGKTNSADDDIYVLKNGWWDDIYITVSVQ